MTAFLDLSDVRTAARERLDDAVWAYVEGGAGDGCTVRANVAAYEHVWLLPGPLGAVGSSPRLETSVLGFPLSMPILLAPTSPQRLVHEEAELATARAAAAEGVCSIVSTDSHHAYPAIDAAGSGSCWFQLYAYASRDTVASTIELAEHASAHALVVTIDATHPARRIVAERAGFRTPGHVEFGTLRALGVFAGAVPRAGRLSRLHLDWEDLAWIRGRTEMPMLVKGILRPGDARRCVDLGVDGVIVSNHGGRQLDGVVPTLAALPGVAREVGGDAAVLVDGGVRSGVDVVRALALGADAVCIGRPYLWGLAVDGEAGVRAVLDLLRRELADTLLQLGVGDVGALSSDDVAICPPLPDVVEALV